jgi:hypothetical protein
LDVDFFWLAVHCLEKYLKGALLMNGKSARSQGHNVPALYAEVCPLAPELMPSILAKPAQWGDDFWYDETPEHFVARLYRNGNPDNRYQLYGYSIRAEDLLKLDQMVFAARRLCQPLETHFFFKRRPDLPDHSFRQRMTIDTDSWRLHSRLEEVIDGKRGDRLRDILLNWNFPFAPPNYKHSRLTVRWASRNPVLERCLLDPLESQYPGNGEKADRLWEWVKANIHLSKDDKRDLEKLRSERRAKATAAKSLKPSG